MTTPLERAAMKWFPVQTTPYQGDSAFVPWDFVAPHEARCQRNHSQSLARLAERGGLSWGELLDVLTDQPYAHHIGTWRLTNAEAAQKVMTMLIEWLRPPAPSEAARELLRDTGKPAAVAANRPQGARVRSDGADRRPERADGRATRRPADRDAARGCGAGDGVRDVRRCGRRNARRRTMGVRGLRLGPRDGRRDVNRRAIANLELQLRVLKNGDRVNDPLVADIERWRVEAKDMETEIATLKRRVRLARAVVAPLIDPEIGKGSRGEHYDPLRDVLPLLDLRKPIGRRR